MKYFLRQVFKEWIIPLLAVVLIFGFIQPSFAQILEQDATLDKSRQQLRNAWHNIQSLE